MIFDVAPITITQKILGFEPMFESEFASFALLTVLIEVPLFYLCGWRKFGDCLYFAAVNVVTNLLLNEFLMATDAEFYWQIVLPSEVVVVMLEFVLCTYRISDNRRKLLATLIFTNAASFLAGLVFI